MKKLLANLSDDECYILYQNMMKNSDRRWDSAKLLADNKDYGGAIQSHITSMEEMIKGFIMFMDSKGFQFRTVQEMESVIRRSHSIRHFIGFTMFIINVFMDDFKRIMPKLKNDPSLLKGYINNIPKIESIAKTYVLKKLVLIKKEYHWFKKVETYRQEGTHVDYDPKIKSPVDINSNDYNEVYQRLTNVREMTKRIIDAFLSTDKRMIMEIEIFKQQFVSEDLYGQIQETLSSKKNAKSV